MNEEKEKSQEQIFCGQWLPSLFHDTPQHFLALLNSDGTKFLSFYWDQAGKDLPEDQCRDSFGLNFTFREPFLYTHITLITLPEPTKVGETHFIALIYRPNRRILLVTDMTKVISLEKAEPDDQNASATRLIEISRKLEREELRGEAVNPWLEDFYQAVLKQLD